MLVRYQSTVKSQSFSFRGDSFVSGEKFNFASYQEKILSKLKTGICFERLAGVNYSSNVVKLLLANVARGDYAREAR